MILQALVGFYDRLERRGEQVPLTGYAPVRIGFVLEIARDGTPTALIDRRDHSQKKPTAPNFMMPKVERTSGIKPAFLWDKTSYVFGITSTKPEGAADDDTRIVPGQGKRTAEENASFKTAHAEALAGTKDEGLEALRLFLERWTPDQWMTFGFTSDALDQNIAFRLQGDQNIRIDVRPAARELVRSRQVVDGELAHCLVTGLDAPFALLQPKFKGVMGAQSSGAPLVSFNADAFESYGKAQGANAPVSEDAAFRYGAALNWLLDRNNSRSFRLGETTLVFWADEAPCDDAEAIATAAEAAIQAEFVSTKDAEPNATAVASDAEADEEADWSEHAAPRDADAEGVTIIGAATENIRTQRKTPDISEIPPGTRMHILGLSPNSGRIAVRLWLDGTYGDFARNIAEHHRLMEIEPPDKPARKKPYALLYETAVLGKAENIPPRLGGELARAILTGSPYPRSLFASVIGRMRADKTINAARAAICKAVINRDNNKEVISVALNPESTDPAYNLGRLFAVYEYAESSVANRNATIRDKFIGAASATPRRVFPLLMRGYEHNASALAKGDGNQRGSAVKASRVVAQILERFDGDEAFPTSLPLESQGRFFVGYYHQNRALYTKADSAADTSAIEKDTP